VGPAGLGTWQHREIQLALDRQAQSERAGHIFPVIPILLPKVEDPPDKVMSRTRGRRRSDGGGMVENEQ
jgi:hypothetical protein